ncbi:MAG TPA: DUF4145 domain-containing protein [Pyrinomonadaceae bacterium]|nr:DUF4145 domain-containing protein [Pyrinomonadaceae bacterium]
MKEKYYPPTFDEQQFHCIHCNVFARQTWADLYIHSGTVTNCGFRSSQCFHCKNRVFWYDGRMIVPDESPVEPHHPDLPADCVGEYQEARSIFSRSPRAAAALLRLCIQKLLPHLGESGENINNDIKSLVAKGLPPLVQKALDYCRVVGNNAVHPGEIDINDTPEIGQNLFRMINFIVEDRITRPREVEELYNQLPEGSRNAIQKRDGNNTPP